MKRQILSNSAKLSSNELIIWGICVEEEKDDAKAATVHFLENKLSLKPNSEDIIETYRGKNSTERMIKNKTVLIPLVMFVHTTEHLCKQILHNTWKLKNSKMTSMDMVIM